MKKVYTTCSLGEAYCVKTLLEAEGVSSIVRNESLMQAQATADGHPSVWILDDGQLEAAESIVCGYTSGDGSSRENSSPWRCPGCGEEHGPQFTTCWQCGADRPKKR